MLDMFAVVEVIPEKLRVKVGQFQIPFGIKHEDHNMLMRAGYNLGSNRRDVGVQFGGTVGNAFYSLSLVNGRSQFLRSSGTSADANQHKSVAMMLGTQMHAIRGGVSGYLNKPGNFESPSLREMRLAAFVTTALKRLMLEGELNLGGEFAPGQSIGFDLDAETGDIRSLGYYLGATTRVISETNVGVRYEWFDPDRRVAGDTQQRVVLQGEYRFLPNASLDIWYWLNIADKARPEIIDDPVRKRQLQGSDQLILMGSFWF